MADQEASIITSVDAENQVSVGLITSPNANIFSYLLNPLKVTDAISCANELNPDYLPLVGIRTRRFGELYPYEALQGYRSGNEVTVVAYMQAEQKDIPPPVRVIAYMRGRLERGHFPVKIANGNLIVGISANGTLGFSSINDFIFGFGLTYKGFDVFFGGDPVNVRESWNVDNLEALDGYSGIFWVARYNVYDPEVLDTTKYSLQEKQNESHATQLISHNTALNGSFNPTPVEIKKTYSVNALSVITVTTEITNVSLVDLVNLRYIKESDYRVAQYNISPGQSKNIGAFNNINDDLCIKHSQGVFGASFGLAIGHYCDSNVSHKCLVTENDPITGIGAQLNGFSSFPMYTTYVIPTLQIGESIILVDHIIFADTADDVIAIANTVSS